MAARAGEYTLPNIMSLQIRMRNGWFPGAERAVHLQLLILLLLLSYYRQPVITEKKKKN